MSMSIREYCNLYKDEIAVEMMNGAGEMEAYWLSELSRIAYDIVVSRFEERGFYPYRLKTDLERKTSPSDN